MTTSKLSTVGVALFSLLLGACDSTDDKLANISSQLKELQGTNSTLVSQNADLTTSLNSCTTNLTNTQAALTQCQQTPVGGGGGGHSGGDLPGGHTYEEIALMLSLFADCQSDLTNYQSLADELRDENNELRDQLSEFVLTNEEFAAALVSNSRVFDLGYTTVISSGFGQRDEARVVIRQSFTSDGRVHQSQFISGVSSTTTVANGSWSVSNGVLTIVPDSGSTFLATTLNLLRMRDGYLYLIPPAVPVTAANWGQVPVTRYEFRQRERFQDEVF